MTFGPWKKNERWTVLNQSFFAMFITFSLIELTNVGAGLIDGLIVSRFLDEQAMAASGIARPIFSISGIFGGMFAAGMQTLCTRELGRGDVPSFNRLFSATVYLGSTISLILTALVLISALPLAMLLGATGTGSVLAEPAALYLRGTGIGLPALIMNGVLASAIQMDSGRKRVMSAAIAGSVMNVFFDLAAVFFDSGLFGIGLATAVSQYLQTALLFTHFLGKDRMLRFSSLNTSVREMLDLLSCGTEKALRRLSGVIRPVIVNKLIIFYGGAMAMTAMSVQSSLRDFTQFFGVGLADATALIVGVLFGEMNDEAIRESRSCVHRHCFLFCGSVCVLLLILARPVAGLYISEEGPLMEMTVFAIRMIAVQAPLNGLVRPRITYLQAVGHNRNMQFLTALSSLIYVAASAFVLGRMFGAYGILASFLVADFLSLLTVWIYYGTKTHKLIPSLEDFMNLPDDFHRGPGDVIYLDVRNTDDISLVSEQIGLFCKGHGISGETGIKASLCFEELALNTIQHGFPKCKKDPGIDLRVVYESRELIVRMQDNCPAFDVERQIAMTVSGGHADPEERIGLKILSGMVSDIKYVHSLETNNIIMRFPIAEG